MTHTYFRGKGSVISPLLFSLFTFAVYIYPSTIDSRVSSASVNRPANV